MSMQKTSTIEELTQSVSDLVKTLTWIASAYEKLNGEAGDVQAMTAMTMRESPAYWRGGLRSVSQLADEALERFGTPRKKEEKTDACNQ